MKASSRFLSAFLVLALMLSCSAFASGTGTTAVTAVEEKAGQEGTGQEGTGQEGTGEEGSGEELSAGVDSTTELFLSLTEGTSKSLAFPLTEEQAAIIEEAARLAQADAKDISDQKAEEATKYLEDAGMEIVTPSEQDYEDMRQMCQPVWETIREDCGAELFDEYTAIVEE